MTSLNQPIQGSECDAVVIGGGVIGSAVARFLAEHSRSVVLLEARRALLQGASFANQARVHRGYHYPRSLLTALRSSVNFPRFVAEFAECLERYSAYYAVGRYGSKVTSSQFKVFCDRIGVPLAPAPPAVRRLFSSTLVEDVFTVEECAFDANRLRLRLEADLKRRGVRVETAARAKRVQAMRGGELQVSYEHAGSSKTLITQEVFNCTYSEVNSLLRNSGLPLIPLKHELTEIALVVVPPELKHVGVTLMCGPYFSLTPFPPRGIHTLSHVRYTPHTWWWEGVIPSAGSERAWNADVTRPLSRFPFMQRDAQRYLPTLHRLSYQGSMWEVKTLLPASEIDDSRPILFRAHHGLQNLHCIIGGKIDNVFDVVDELADHFRRAHVA